MALFGRGSRPEQRGTPSDALVIGLGNPGKEYQGTRHNLGVEVLEELARRHGGVLKRSKQRAMVAEVTIAGKRVALAFPQTYMNLSGEAAAMLVRRFGIEAPERIVVVHDELDLPPGTLKVKEGGGLAGHNGLRSLHQHLKTDAFLRVRIGVGKPPAARSRARGPRAAQADQGRAGQMGVDRAGGGRRRRGDHHRRRRRHDEPLHAC